MLYLITILIALCQVTLVNVISIGNIKPDFLLVYIVFVALYKGPVKAAIAGILAGFLKDVFSAGVFFNILTVPVYGILVGLVKEKFYFVKEKLSTQFLMVLAICVFEMFAQVFYFANWDYPPPGLVLVLFIGVPAVAYTSIVSVPFFHLLKKIYAV